MRQKIDAREATLRVKQYFEEAHGYWGVLRFMVRNVEHKVDEGKWIVTCSFHRELGSTEDSYYQVEVQDDGMIAAVAEVEGPQ